MTDINKYINKVREDTIREIKKRKQTNCNDSNGNKFDMKNSHFGQGAVPDTIPTVKKDLEEIRKRFNILITQVKFPESYLEREPRTKRVAYEKKKKNVSVVEPLALNNNDENDIRIPKSIKEWRDECEKNIISGSIGLVPECYQDEFPSLGIFMSSNVGQVLINFITFLKNKIL
jgi:hypothetical protein